MDTRRLITLVLVTFAAIMLWQVGLDWFGRQMGWDMSRQRPEPPAATTTQPTTAPATAPGVASAETPPSTTGPAAPITGPGLRVAPAPQQQTAEPVQIGSAAANDPNYRMGVKLSPEGAGVESVVLNQYKRIAGSDDRYIFQEPYSEAHRLTRPLATRLITIDGAAVDLHNVIWALDPARTNESTATFIATIENGAGPVVRLIKSFEVTPTTDPGRGYELVTRLAWENLSDRPIAVRSTFNGPTMPPREIDRGPDRYVLSGYWDRASPNDPVSVINHPVEAFVKDDATKDLTVSDEKYKLPLIWAGAASTYFNALVRPIPAEGSVPQYIEKVQAASLDPNAEAENLDVVLTFQTNEIELQPGQTQSFDLRAYLGPKQRSLLKNDYYSAVGFNETLVITGGLCAFCTFQWLIDLLVIMLRGFHWLFGGFAGNGDWGLAIIGLVAIVRLMLHPITKKSQVSMMRMQKMGPEMERLRQKHGDNKEELSKAMMQFYKEQGVGPYLGCLPMFLQMPIWIALWSALNSTFELRQAPFLWGLTWIDDLSKPDHLLEFANPFWILGFIHVSGLNVLPLLLAVVFYLQMKYQPKPATMTKEQEQQQKIMMWMMPIMFPIMLYSGPSGLNLYILASTFTGIIESKVIRKHIKEREEAEKAGRVIVDAGKKIGGGGDGAKRTPKKTEPPKGGISGWLANLQQKAEQLQREADRKRNSGGR